MKTPRFNISAFAVGSSIYVCGGRDRDDNVLFSVEQFIVNDSRGWIELPEMNQRRFSLIPILCIFFLTL